MATRGWPSDGSFPVVLSPRKTKLISTHPTLRWTSVKGATAYTVVTSATELVYPQEAPQLEADVDYRVIVVADEGRAGDEPGLSFSLLNSKDKKAVLQEQKQIENLGMPEDPTQFLIAYLYTDRGLYAEAIRATARSFAEVQDVCRTKAIGRLAHRHWAAAAGRS